MQYRKMPKSQDKLSVLGYGCMRLPVKGAGGPLGQIDVEEAKKQILYAIDNGVNYLDTAWPYHRGGSESFLGDHILKDGYREKVYIATKLPCFFISKKDKIEEIFNKQLKKLKVEYIDYYLLHSLDGGSWEKMLNLGIIEWMDKIKAEKKVRYMGFSFHGTHDDFIKIVDGYDWDFTQVQFNIIDENFQAGIKGIEYAAKKGLGVIGMETLRGGALVGDIPTEVQAIYDKAEQKRSAADWAFRWVYNNPNITLVLSGMNDMEHIKENIKVADETHVNSLSKEEVKIIDDVRDKYLELLKVGCTGCAYCMPCPAKIDIPGAFKNLNNYHMFGKLGAKVNHLQTAGVMTEDGNAHFSNSCIDCGKCEEKCPQNIEVRKELKQVQKDLEGPFIKVLASIGRAVLGSGKKIK